MRVHSVPLFLLFLHSIHTNAAPSPPPPAALSDGALGSHTHNVTTLSAPLQSSDGSGRRFRAKRLTALDVAENPVFSAYATQLAKLMAAPEAERRYVIARPLSGWGNKIRVVATAMQLALALDRILLVDASLMGPFYGPIFRAPHTPWLTRDVQGGLDAVMARGAVRLILKSPHKTNAAMRCWMSTHRLSSCLRVARVVAGGTGAAADGGVTVLIFEGYFNGDRHVHADTELMAPLRAALPALIPAAVLPLSAGGHNARFSPDARVKLDQLMLQSLLPAPSRRLQLEVRNARVALRWDAAMLHIGVHMRVFVDYLRRKVSPSAIAPAYWSCVERHVKAAQTALGVAPNTTLIFIASDTMAVRPRARAALSHLGRVEWVPPPARGGRGFVHTEKRRDASSLAQVMTDWVLLSESDALIGTDLSTFGPAAAVKGGIPLALASMKRGGKCGRMERPHLGTVN